MVCAVVALALPGWADSQARIVRLSYVDGGVTIDRGTGQGFERAILNMPITQDVKLRTGAEGRAEIEFENGSTVRLAPRSEVAFTQLGMRDSGEPVTVANLSQGTAYVNLRQKRAGDFRVAVASRELAVKKGSHIRVALGDQQVAVAVFSGEVEAANGEQEVRAKKDETLSFDRDQSAQYLVAKGIEQQDLDNWDAGRAKYQERYTVANNYAMGSPYYGLSDLNYYGSFYNAPGWGYLWQPFDAFYGWNPFYAGAWSYYPGFGYAWVSPYPWGWTPFRYGQWVYIPSWGWGWRPGNAWITPVALPMVVNAPPGYRLPVRPTQLAAGVSPTVLVGSGVSGTPSYGPVATPRAPVSTAVKSAMPSGMVPTVPYGVINGLPPSSRVIRRAGMPTPAPRQMPAPAARGFSSGASYSHGGSPSASSGGRAAHR
jgi:hypothetical protein